LPFWRTRKALESDRSSEYRDEVAGSSVKLVPIEARTPNDIERAFDELKRTRVDGLLVLSDAMFFTEVERILALAHAARLPAIHGFREHVERGGLMSYGVNIPQNFQRAAYFVDRILKGSRAGDLPIELPTKLELVINLKTAKALGLEVPSKLLFTADEVIE
jgi:putative ABC transport system substrate-binding protein